ncbi:hypothetical protein G6F35_016976 [Rhizopus arrhizus]|nr:hypothetical protein G6F35_016976 [Rhizopus arrhizus]
MPHLLEGSPAPAIRDALETMKRVLEAAEPLSPAARESLDEMERIFVAAERRAQKRSPASAPAKLPAPAAAPAPSVPALKLFKAAADVPAKKAQPHPAAAQSAAAEADGQIGKQAGDDGRG